jgi:hypothetical protein
VTVWAGHELYRHLKSKRVLSQMRERIDAQYSALDDLLEFVDESCDDASCRPSVYPNREAALDQLRLRATEIQSYLQSQQANKQLDTTYSSAEQEIVDFVNRHSVQTEALRFVSTMSPTYKNRFKGRVPPGYKDGGKPENAFGDLIFWQEILEHAKDTPTVLVLSNDKKVDWRHYSTSVETYRGRHLGHEPQIGAVAQFPHPMLTFEARVAGIVHLDVISIPILASLLEIQSQNSVPSLLAAAFPRKVQAKARPDWEALGIDRASLELVQLVDISIESLRGYEPSETFAEVLSSLTGTLERRREMLGGASLPVVLSELNAVGLARFGQAAFDSSRETEGAVSLTDVLVLASTMSQNSRSAVLLGMLIGIFFDSGCNPRNTPEGATGQSVMMIALEEPTKSLRQQLREMLRLENVWVLAVPPWRANSTPIDFALVAEDGVASKRLESVVFNGAELLDTASAESRRLSRFLGASIASVREILKVVAVECSIPVSMMSVEQDLDSLVHWDESIGFGILRTDHKRVMTDLELLMEEEG